MQPVVSDPAPAVYEGIVTLLAEKDGRLRMRIGSGHLAPQEVETSRSALDTNSQRLLRVDDTRPVRPGSRYLATIHDDPSSRIVQLKMLLTEPAT